MPSRSPIASVCSRFYPRWCLSAQACVPSPLVLLVLARSLLGCSHRDRQEAIVLPLPGHTLPVRPRGCRCPALAGWRCLSSRARSRPRRPLPVPAVSGRRSSGRPARAPARRSVLICQLACCRPGPPGLRRRARCRRGYQPIRQTITPKSTAQSPSTSGRLVSKPRQGARLFSGSLARGGRGCCVRRGVATAVSVRVAACCRIPQGQGHGAGVTSSAARAPAGSGPPPGPARWGGPPSGRAMPPGCPPVLSAPTGGGAGPGAGGGVAAVGAGRPPCLPALNVWQRGRPPAGGARGPRSP